MLTAIILVVVVGLIASVMLVIASKVFFVPTDETAAALREELPGANCGGCGYAGCDDYANALAADHDQPCNKCVVGGAAVAARLAEILGVSAGSEEKQVAVVMCNGRNEVTQKLLEYQGFGTCEAAKQIFSGSKVCSFGCLGFGDCVEACQFDSIRLFQGVAKVDRDTCVACGACVKACPQSLIRLAPESNKVVVFCRNSDSGAQTRKACQVGCIGCKLCEKACKFDAVHVENNLAFIDPAKCRNCGACARVCPTGAIQNLRLIHRRQAAVSPAATAKPVVPAAETPKSDAAADAVR